MARRKKGTGTIQHDKTRGDYTARTADRARSGRFATRKEAEAALNVWNKQIADGLDLGSSRQSVQYFLSSWLADVANKRVKPITQEFYARHLNYAISELGSIAIGELNAQQVQRALNSLQKDGLAPRSVAHVRAVLRNALNTAIKWNLTLTNAASLADAPRIPAAHDRVLEPEAITALLAAVAEHRLGTLFEILIVMGLRPSEGLALHWRDIDMDAEILTVADSKTVSGMRVLPMPPDIVRGLRVHWRSQQEERIVLGLKWREHGLVFPSERGTRIGERNFVRTFKVVAKRAGLAPDVQLYDLRRTAISWMIEIGGDPRTAQTVAGHSSPDVTQRIYARSRQAVQREMLTEAERRRKTGT